MSEPFSVDERIGTPVTEELEVSPRSDQAAANVVTEWVRGLLRQYPDLDVVDWEFDRSRGVVVASAIVFAEIPRGSACHDTPDVGAS